MIQRTIFDYLPPEGGNKPPRKDRKRLGLCRDCAAPARPGKTYCQDCAKKAAKLLAARASTLKAQGLCTKCTAPASPGKTRCNACAEMGAKFVAARTSALKAQGLCKQCGKCPLAESSGFYCDSCLKLVRERIAAKRKTDFGKWENSVRARTPQTAKGIQLTAPTCFDWTHEDFRVCFVEYPAGPKNVIDHKIPLACAELPGGKVDKAFGRICADLPNLQLLTQRGNSKKGRNLDEVIAARSDQLRAEGLAGAALFRRLCDEFSEQAEVYADIGDE